MKRCIYFVTHDRPTIRRIEERFGIPRWRSINGEVIADIKDEDYPTLQETARRGFIQIRNKPIF